MLFADKLTLGTPRRTREGYLAVRAKAARSGVYDYRGIEVDPEGKRFKADEIVKVYRPENEVFNKDSVHSFLLKPITDDHPSEPVTADNWKAHAKGVNAGAMRDGEHLAFDLVVMDASAIDAIDKGKKELSNGYGCDLSFEDGVAPDGEAYQAVQRNIVGNHIALVRAGRAGPECRIGDAAPCDRMPQDPLGELMWKMINDVLGDERTYNPNPNDNKNNPTNAGRQSGDFKMPHTLMIDGLQVPNVSDEAKAAIEKLQGQVRASDEAKTKVETDLATAKTDLAARDAEIVNLKKSVEDAKVTPAQLRDQAKAYAQVCDKAKALKVEFAEDADAETIKKAVVDAKMGDTAKDYDAKQVAAAFDVLTKDAKTEDKGPDQLRDALSSGVRTNDAKTGVNSARTAWLNNKQTAYRGQPAN